MPILTRSAPTGGAVRSWWSSSAPPVRFVSLRGCGVAGKTAVAGLAPLPDLPPLIRRLPDPVSTPPDPVSTPPASVPALPASVASLPLPVTSGADPGLSVFAPALESPLASSPPPAPSAPRPVIRASSPGRYHVQLTVGQESHDRFRRLQALLARECRGGDPVAVFDLACRVLEEKVLKEKRAATKPRRTPRRSGTALAGGDETRDIPTAVRRTVWARDGERCAFVGPDGVRCPETKYLELHHTVPWALCRRSAPDILSVRCRAHNQYEAELVFGPRVTQRRRSKAGPSLTAGP